MSSTPVPDPNAPQNEPITLLSLDIAAYSATLAADDEGVMLLLPSAAYRLVPGRAPVRTPLDLGIGPAVTGSSITFWSKGFVWRAPKRGGKPIRVGAAAHQPQSLAASESDLAFLDRSEAGRTSIQTLDGGKARTVYASAGAITSLTMLRDWVFFVEQAPDSSWRIGAVSVSGKQQPSFTAARGGRTPSMLAASNDEVFFYDGPTLTVRRLSPDLIHEEPIAHDFICSPIAVAKSVFCAQVEGLFAVSRQGGTPVTVSTRRAGSITAVAASANRVAWLVDTGPNRLAVEMLSLTATPTK